MKLKKQIETFKDYSIREVNVNYRRTKTGRIPITKAIDVVTFLRSVLKDNSREQLIALYLDGAHNVACYSIVSIGTANQAPVSPREIFQRAVLAGATALILAHNHPSGSAQPSVQDRCVTEKIKTAGELLEIRVLDHIVFTDTSYYSIEEGCLQMF